MLPTTHAAVMHGSDRKRALNPFRTNAMAGTAGGISALCPEQESGFTVQVFHLNTYTSPRCYRKGMIDRFHSNHNFTSVFIMYGSWRSLLWMIRIIILKQNNITDKIQFLI